MFEYKFLSRAKRRYGMMRTKRAYTGINKVGGGNVCEAQLCLPPPLVVPGGGKILTVDSKHLVSALHCPPLLPLYTPFIRKEYTTRIRTEYTTRICTKYTTRIRTEYTTRFCSEYTTRICTEYTTRIRTEYTTRICSEYTTRICTFLVP